MSTASNLPRAAEPFIAFAQALRANGFAVAPEQTQDFIAGVGLLGPRGMQDIHRAAVATLAPPPERRDEFDALFRMVFLGQTIAAAAQAGDEDEVQAYDAREGGAEPPEAEEPEESGGEASGAEILSRRAFGEREDAAALLRLRRSAPAALPRRRSRRRVTTKSSGQPDLRRALRQAVRRDGELLQLPTRERALRQRRLLLLIDVSGSMKAETEGAMRFAHALMRAAERYEAFTIGTRLTRVTPALRHRNPDQALANAAGLVADWDGGTRIGDALQAFLAVPRFAGFARGALVIVVSDGLERGDPAALNEAIARLRRLAWKILWLTPLATSGTAFVPRTEAMEGIAPHVTRFGSAAGIAAMCEEVLQFAGRAA